jgi:hypothetical protein
MQGLHVRDSCLTQIAEEIAWNVSMQSVHIKCKECVGKVFDLEK